MRITNTTIQSAETLIEFNRQHMRKNPLFWVSFILGGFYIILVVAINVLWLLLYGEPYVDSLLTICLIAILVMDLYLVLFYAFILKLMVKKSPSLDAKVEYVFTPEAFEDHTVSDKINTSSTIQYTMIRRARETKNFFYLYIASNVAHIVDKRGFTEGTAQDLRFLLIQQLDPKKRNF